MNETSTNPAFSFDNSAVIDTYASSPATAWSYQDKRRPHPIAPERAAPTTATAYDVAIIGLGRWAQQVLLPILASEEFAFIGHRHLVSEQFPPDLPSAATGNATAYPAAQLGTVLANPNITAVLICTPDLTHSELVERALHAGKSVFVEKPLALSARASKRLVELARQRGLTLLVGYQYMYDERFLALAKMLGNGKFGRVREVHFRLINAAPAGPTNAGTSLIQHHTVHQLSVLQTLFGRAGLCDLEILEASNDHVRLRFTYRDTSIHLTTRVGNLHGCNLRTIDIQGSRLNVHLNYDGFAPSFLVEHAHTLEEIPPEDSEYPEELLRLGRTPPVSAELREFFRAIGSGREPVSGGDNAEHLAGMMETLHTAFLAAQSSRAQASLASRNEQARDIRHHLNELCRESRSDLAESTLENLADSVHLIAEHFQDNPFATARQIAVRFGLDVQTLNLAYKAIQRSEAIQRYLRQGNNYDCWDVIDSFFNYQNFEATFFVGIVCPYKCTFCKMQMTAHEVPANTPRFDYRKSELMTLADIDGTLDDLTLMRRNNFRVTVKISGGLEPLTDMVRVSHIIDSATARGLPVKLYTNGALINSAETRHKVLKTNEIRVSLNTVNENKYRKVYLNDSDGKKHRMSLSKLLGLIEALLQEKRITGAETRVGLNFVVIRDTISDMPKMARLAAGLGLDYINYNIDYFDAFTSEEYTEIEDNIKYIQSLGRHGELGRLNTNFGGSLLAKNIFAAPPGGGFDPSGMSAYKVFIEPGGYVTPIHEGTYAYRSLDHGPEENPYSLGRIRNGSRLSALLEARKTLPDIGYQYLAPLELILSLAMLREMVDTEFGIHPENSPYRTLCAPYPLA